MKVATTAIFPLRGAKGHGFKILLLCIALGFVACSFPKPEDGYTGLACRGDEDCAGVAGKGVCDLGGNKTCVQCTTGKKDACTGATPACGDNLVCRGCIAHSECGSDACSFGGACIAETDVIYLKEGAGGGGNCTQAAPCGSITNAINQVTVSRRYIRVTGATTSEVDISGRAVTFLGSADGTSILRGGGGGGGDAIFDLMGGANVQMYDMTLEDSRSEGITISATSMLTMVRSKIVNATREGLLVDGKATLLQSEVFSCNDPAKRGINVLDGGELVMDRSKVSENEGGGILIADGGKFSITNSFIVGNKATGGLFAINPSSGSKLEFSTIVDNISGGGTTAAGGVVCDNANGSVRNNIIFRNIGGTGGVVQKLGQCIFTGNLDMAGVSATDDTLKFAGAKDYHLTPASPASVKDAGGLTCPAVDFDGDTRPQGPACDLGADELK